MPYASRTPAPPSRKTQRQPRQSRGEVRVAAILDACERVLMEEGEGALGMHKVAATARTSIGSLYHFFPDKQSLLRALSERHEAAAQAIAHEIGLIPDQTWQVASAQDVIALLIQPLLDYVDRNPALLYLIRLDRKTGKSPTHNPVQPLLYALCLRILKLRMPEAGEADTKACAATLLGLPLGLVADLMVDYDVNMRSTVLHREIPRALVAYLQAIENRQ